MVITAAIIKLFFSHIGAILVGWGTKAWAFTKAEEAKVKPEAEAILAKVRAEVTKFEVVAETDAKKVIAAIKAWL